MNYPIKIVGAVVDHHNLTMYREDGETITIPQGDGRIKQLVEELVPALETPGGYYWLTEEVMTGKNHYAETEKKSNGFVRFFKMAKSKLKEIAEKFCEPVPDLKVGTTNVQMLHEVSGTVLNQETGEGAPLVPERKLPPEEERPLTKSAAAVAEIMANAKNTSAQDFSNVTSEVGEEQVIVAITEDNTVIPGVEQLATQMQAVSEGITSSDGMNRFLQRAGSVQRGHSVEDLLKFVQKGELPFADDGSVLVYKRLNLTSVEGVFVDVHSGRVKQSVGSFVHMAEQLVDPSRSRDCSNGLHVARRDYLSAFSGNVTVLAKLAPEDVIAVPHRDARKLRAKGYHIIAVLSEEDARRVCSNQPMKDTKLLADAVAGNHVGILEYVEITEQRGGGLKVTKVTPEERAAVEARNVHSLDHMVATAETTSSVDARALALDLAKSGADKTMAVTVEGGEITKVEKLIQAPPGGMNVTSEPVGEATAVPGLQGVQAEWEADGRKAIEASPAQTKTPAQCLARNFEFTGSLFDAQALVDFKKKSKKSWTALGIPAAVFDKALEQVNGVKPSPVEEAAPAPVVKPVKAKAKATVKTKVTKTGTVTKATAAKGVDLRDVIGIPTTPKAKPATTSKVPKMTQQEEMAKLVKLYENNSDKMNARAIYAFKQKTKKSWEVLGVTDVKFQKKITERAKL